jgi:Flp pilus assembly protein TadD
MCKRQWPEAGAPKLVCSRLRKPFLAALLCLAASIGVGWAAQDAEYQTAVSLVQQGQFDRAFPILEQILERSPKDLKARNLMGIALLGKILMRDGRFDQAAREFEKALELDPEDMTITYQLAQALQRTGETARAKQLFAKVSEAKSNGVESTQRQLLRIIRIESQR